MNLKEWLYQNRVKHVAFAKQIGCTPAYFSLLVNEWSIPSQELKKKIEGATKGEIAADSWPTKASHVI